MMAEGQTQVQETSKRKLRRLDQGVVIADGRNKTIKVAVEYMVKHSRYNKYLRKQITHHVHTSRTRRRLGIRSRLWNVVRFPRRRTGGWFGC